MLGPRRGGASHILGKLWASTSQKQLPIVTIKPHMFLTFALIFNVSHHLFIPSVLFDIFPVAMHCVAEEDLTCDKKKERLLGLYISSDQKKG